MFPKIKESFEAYSPVLLMSTTAAHLQLRTCSALAAAHLQQRAYSSALTAARLRALLKTGLALVGLQSCGYRNDDRSGKRQSVLQLRQRSLHRLQS